jgi:Arc/MetJ-type ribon-helix-helix transcriptional regulator
MVVGLIRTIVTNHPLHTDHQMVACSYMRRTSISLPDDLAKALDNYIEAQEVRPAVTSVMQAALREYLDVRGFLRAPQRLKASKKNGRK